MLRIEHYSKSYGSKLAVDDLSLHIRPGEIFGFIGPNGAGKTTTLKAVCGILPFSKGEIFIDGTSIRSDPLACKKKLAYVPDNPDLYEFLTGAGYLNFVADVYGVSATRRKELAERYGAMFSLTGELSQPIAGYSHGMKQKLALMAALIHEPRLLVLDEPFVGLDPKAAHDLKQVMRELCDRGGAIFFSSHVLEVVEKLCDSVAIIQKGRLIAAGSTDEIRGDRSLEDVFLELEG